ncbi:hypothetical protein LB534_18200 [Mesorhizobium sp. CA18]|uniref:hypothetical protein n=1 Tax=unclassified Mesorhizobium TaxID=325217 RepID=UPI001CCA5805|nr:MULTISPECIES: hypothetical protein [unclassified Mesorhizobium]MBZ9736566.1 hypothetical protein [Mesorhizobium sp. CA9]MBZ9827220.1 hypothetical protein [Mesorhizobium sp. CA18]MBZ9832755.1 hypothetical protein [Mesorhizobium sp. CA2]MBZ9839032.1 hypothetical protein [Mesorhizobium sp. CA3]MBZ9879485.1 hypothetical protein [Mesorhizobium sp. Ca11]
MRHDRLVLILLWRELVAGLRATRRRDLAWIALGGGGLLAYAIADIVVALHAAGPKLRHDQLLWMLGLPVAFAALGWLAGNAMSRLCLSRAFAPFLKALPLASAERRRMAAVGAFALGLPLTLMIATAVGFACAVIGKPLAPAWGLGAATLFALSFGTAGLWRLRRPHLLVDVAASEAAPVGRPWLRRLDRARPSWLSSWAWKLPARNIRPSWKLAAASLLLGLATILGAWASLAGHTAGPAAVAGLAGGILVFMLSLRCQPLGSPVLRTAPIGFTRVWLRLVRLPLQLSLAFFLLPAGAALAAEPSAWSVPVASGLWLLVLNGAYAVFGAFFLNTPFVAMLSFAGALAYAGYETLEYGRTVLIGLAALVFFLWHRTRQRYRNG